MSEYGIFNPKPYDSEFGKKVLNVFEKLKKKTVESHRVRSDPRLGEHDEESYFNQLRRDAMKSLHIVPEVMKTEEGFIVDESI